MKKIIIAPDSFKGTLSSNEVCDIIESEIKAKYTDIEIKKVPIADGGEGTVESYLSIAGGKKIYVTVKSPLGHDITAYYALLNENVAVIEMAQASGITIEKQNDALLASTYGTGELIKHAIENGAKSIILGLGGSATTDGGVGCVQALGGLFKDKDGNDVLSGGVHLKDIQTIQLDNVKQLIKDIDITVLCDVKNPLYGQNGAAYIYSPQKGANEDQVRILDNGLKHLAKITKDTLNIDYSLVEGAGAAGGMGFACIAYLNATLKSGIDTILDFAEFEKEADDADLVITGEGKMDDQSLMGKAPFGVANRCKNCKVIAIVGLLAADKNKAKELGIEEIYETNPEHKPFEDIKNSAKEDLAKTVRSIFN